MRVLLCSLFLAVVGFALADKPAAATVISEAKIKASKEHKSIFVMFDASW